MDRSLIRYLIVDDEYIAHDIIKKYCDVLSYLECASQCYDAVEALEYLAQHKVDLIFLDLNMPGLKGFEFLRSLSHPPKVIVTTAYKEYALEGYELNIVDYLLKPFGFDRFLKAVNKAVQSGQHFIAPVTEEEASAQIFLHSNKKYIQVAVKDILFVEAAGNYAKVVLTNGNIMIREKISDVLEILPVNDFIQVHKSFIVARKHINEIEGNTILIKAFTIPIGKTFKGNVSKLFT